MTYCEEVGLKVGDKILTGQGKILTLHEDDGGSSPWFYSHEMNEVSFDLKRNWQKIPEVTLKPPITKDTIVDMQFTMEELFVLNLLTGQPQTRCIPEGLYSKLCSSVNRKGKGPDVLARSYNYKDIDVENIYWDIDDFNSWVASHFETPDTIKAKQLREQAAKLIEEAEELEKQACSQ
jgi:hypothetical protein